MSLAGPWNSRLGVEETETRTLGRQNMTPTVRKKNLFFYTEGDFEEFGAVESYDYF